MAQTQTQSYAKHAHTPKPSGLAGLLTLLAIVLLAYDAIRRPSAQTVALVVLALAVMVLVGISRLYTVKLQDRVIRLEMRLRLERLGLAHHFARLTTEQIVALRFASDAELPVLVDRALNEAMTRDQIKRAVTDWQADLHRT